MLKLALKLYQTNFILRSMGMDDIDQILAPFFEDIDIKDEVKEEMEKRFKKYKLLVGAIVWVSNAEAIMGMMNSWEVNWLYDQFEARRELPELYGERLQMICDMGNNLTCGRLLSTVLHGLKFVPKGMAQA